MLILLCRDRTYRDRIYRFTPY